MYQLQEQMPENHGTTRRIENEKLRIGSTNAQQKHEDKQETKRISREKKKPKPRKAGKQKRQ
jgi:hypothetical protein